jgi:hypothetical protein
VNILMEAASITAGNRQQDYGHPRDNHTRTAGGWRWYLKAKYGVDIPLDAEDVCWLNSLQKISRHCHEPKRDNLVDVVGYTRNIEMLDEGVTFEVSDE